MTNQSAKEQLREILTRYEMSTNPHLKPLNQSLTPINHEEALSQIEEIVMGVLGEKEIGFMPGKPGMMRDHAERIIGSNQRLARQLKRWDDKVSEA